MHPWEFQGWRINGFLYSGLGTSIPLPDILFDVDLVAQFTELGEGETPCQCNLDGHSADTGNDWIIDRDEIERVAYELYGFPFGYECKGDTIDGYQIYNGSSEVSRGCCPHDSDYDLIDWFIDLSEFGRLSQLYNSNDGHYRPRHDSEDGFEPGLFFTEDDFLLDIAVDCEMKSATLEVEIKAATILGGLEGDVFVSISGLPGVWSAPGLRDYSNPAPSHLLMGGELMITWEDVDDDDFPLTCTYFLNIFDCGNGYTSGQITATVATQKNQDCRFEANLVTSVAGVPAISLVGPDHIQIPCGGMYSEQGAFSHDFLYGSMPINPQTIEVFDAENYFMGLTIDDTFDPGEYSVRYSWTNIDDVSANPVIRTVTIDNEMDVLISQDIILSCDGSARLILEIGDGSILGGLSGDVVLTLSNFPTGWNNPHLIGEENTPTLAINAGVLTITWEEVDEDDFPLTCFYELSIPDCNIEPFSNNYTLDIAAVSSCSLQGTLENDFLSTPVITLVGPDHVQILCGAEYTEEGATVDDPNDGPSSITLANYQNIHVYDSEGIPQGHTIDENFEPGEYTVQYTWTNNASIDALPVIRTVNVGYELDDLVFHEIVVNCEMNIATMYVQIEETSILGAFDGDVNVSISGFPTGWLNPLIIDLGETPETMPSLQMSGGQLTITWEGVSQDDFPLTCLWAMKIQDCNLLLPNDTVAAEVSIESDSPCSIVSTNDSVIMLAPAIILNGPAHVEIPCGGMYIEYGATINDFHYGSALIAGGDEENINVFDGDDLLGHTIDASFAPGEYTVQYTWTNSAGAKARPVFRSVTVGECQIEGEETSFTVTVTGDFAGQVQVLGAMESLGYNEYDVYPGSTLELVAPDTLSYEGTDYYFLKYVIEENELTLTNRESRLTVDKNLSIAVNYSLFHEITFDIDGDGDGVIRYFPPGEGESGEYVIVTRNDGSHTARFRGAPSEVHAEPSGKNGFRQWNRGQSGQPDDTLTYSPLIRENLLETTSLTAVFDPCHLAPSLRGVRIATFGASRSISQISTPYSVFPPILLCVLFETGLNGPFMPIAHHALISAGVSEITEINSLTELTREHFDIFFTGPLYGPTEISEQYLIRFVGRGSRGPILLDENDERSDVLMNTFEGDAILSYEEQEALIQFVQEGGGVVALGFRMSSPTIKKHKNNKEEFHLGPIVMGDYKVFNKSQVDYEATINSLMGCFGVNIDMSGISVSQDDITILISNSECSYPLNRGPFGNLTEERTFVPYKPAHLMWVDEEGESHPCIAVQADVEGEQSLRDVVFALTQSKGLEQLFPGQQVMGRVIFITDETFMMQTRLIEAFFHNHFKYLNNEPIEIELQDGIENEANFAFFLNAFNYVSPIRCAEDIEGELEGEPEGEPGEGEGEWGEGEEEFIPSTNQQCMWRGAGEYYPRWPELLCDRFSTMSPGVNLNPGQTREYGINIPEALQWGDYELSSLNLLFENTSPNPVNVTVDVRIAGQQIPIYRLTFEVPARRIYYVYGNMENPLPGTLPNDRLVFRISNDGEDELSLRWGLHVAGDRILKTSLTLSRSTYDRGDCLFDGPGVYFANPDGCFDNEPRAESLYVLLEGMEPSSKSSGPSSISFRLTDIPQAAAATHALTSVQGRLYAPMGDATALVSLKVFGSYLLQDVPITVTGGEQAYIFYPIPGTQFGPLLPSETNWEEIDPEDRQIVCTIANGGEEDFYVLFTPAPRGESGVINELFSTSISISAYSESVFEPNCVLDPGVSGHFYLHPFPGETPGDGCLSSTPVAHHSFFNPVSNNFITLEIPAETSVRFKLELPELEHNQYQAAYADYLVETGENGGAEVGARLYIERAESTEVLLYERAEEGAWQLPQDSYYYLWEDFMNVPIPQTFPGDTLYFEVTNFSELYPITLVYRDIGGNYDIASYVYLKKRIPCDYIAPGIYYPRVDTGCLSTDSHATGTNYITVQAYDAVEYNLDTGNLQNEELCIDRLEVLFASEYEQAQIVVQLCINEIPFFTSHPWFSQQNQIGLAEIIGESAICIAKKETSEAGIEGDQLRLRIINAGNEPLRVYPRFGHYYTLIGVSDDCAESCLSQEGEGEGEGLTVYTITTTVSPPGAGYLILNPPNSPGLPPGSYYHESLITAFAYYNDLIWEFEGWRVSGEEPIYNNLNPLPFSMPNLNFQLGIQFSELGEGEGEICECEGEVPAECACYCDSRNLGFIPPVAECMCEELLRISQQQGIPLYKQLLRDWHSSDLDGNGIIEKDELALVQMVLCDPAMPEHDLVKPLVEHNEDLIRQEKGFNLYLWPYYELLARLMVISPQSQAFWKGALWAEFNGNPEYLLKSNDYMYYGGTMVFYPPLAPDGDFDRDGVSNKCERDVALNRMDYAIRAIDPSRTDTGQGCGPLLPSDDPADPAAPVILRIGGTWANAAKVDGPGLLAAMSDSPEFLVRRGSVVILSAVHQAGNYHFSHWHVSGESAFRYDNPLYLTVNANTTVSPGYTDKQTITFDIECFGENCVNPGKIKVLDPAGTKVTIGVSAAYQVLEVPKTYTYTWGEHYLWAEPEAGYAFLGWYGDPSIEGRTDLYLSASLPAEATITAVFGQCTDAPFEVINLDNDLINTPIDTQPGGWSSLPGWTGIVTAKDIETHERYITNSSPTSALIERIQRIADTEINFSYRFALDSDGYYHMDQEIWVHSRHEDYNERATLVISPFILSIKNNGGTNQDSISVGHYSAADTWYDVHIRTFGHTMNVWIMQQEERQIEWEIAIRSIPPIVSTDDSPLHFYGNTRLRLILFPNGAEVSSIHLAGLSVTGYPPCSDIPSAECDNLAITEVAPVNAPGGYNDPEFPNEYPGWIEIHNGENHTVSLLGWSLTNDPAQPQKWQFPDVTIEPDEYMVIFLSGKGLATTGFLHAGFEFDVNRRTIALVCEFPRRSGAIYQYPELGEGMSYSLFEFGNKSVTSAGYQGTTEPPSPGNPNEPENRLLEVLLGRNTMVWFAERITTFVGALIQSETTYATLQQLTQNEEGYRPEHHPGWRFWKNNFPAIETYIDSETSLPKQIFGPEPPENFIDNAQWYMNNLLDYEVFHWYGHHFVKQLGGYGWYNRGNQQYTAWIVKRPTRFEQVSNIFWPSYEHIGDYLAVEQVKKAVADVKAQRVRENQPVKLFRYVHFDACNSALVHNTLGNIGEKWREAFDAVVFVGWSGNVAPLHVRKFWNYYRVQLTNHPNKTVYTAIQDANYDLQNNLEEWALLLQLYQLLMITRDFQTLPEPYVIVKPGFEDWTIGDLFNIEY